MVKKSRFSRPILSPPSPSPSQFPSSTQTPPPKQTFIFPFDCKEPQGFFQKFFLLILFATTLSEWVVVNVVNSYILRTEIDPSFLSLAVFLSLLLIGFALSWLSLFKLSHKAFVLQYLAFTLTALCFSVIVFFIRFSFARRAFEVGSPSFWCSLCFSMINAISNTIVGDLLFPYWHLKILPSLGNVFALLLAYQHAHGTTALESQWLIILVSCASIFILSLMKSQVTVRTPSKGIESDIWSQIHQFTLNQIPSAIAIINAEEKLVFTNNYYDTLSRKFERSLLEEVTSLEITSPNFHELLLNIPQFSRISPKSEQGDSKIAFTKILDYEENSDQEAVKISSCIDKFGNLTEAVRSIQRLGNSELMNKAFILKGEITNSDGLNPTSPVDIKICGVPDRKELVLILNEVQTRDIVLPSENDYKDKLLATVSHEMRTPLNGNLTLIETAMNDDELPLHIKENFLMPAYQSGQLLWHLVNDILDMAQIQAKKLRLSYERLPLKTTIESCCQIVRLKAQAKGVNLVTDLNPDLPTYFYTDHKRLSQVILNLVSNALKFTFKGEVRISVKSLSSSFLEFTVSDTGIGMAQEDVDKLFKHFTRINYGKFKNINTAGVGLGLSIANNLVKMLGAPVSRGITVKSVPDHGSTFSFFLTEAKTEEDEMLSQNPVLSPLHKDSYNPSTQEGCSDDKSRYECGNLEVRTPYLSSSPKNLQKLMRRKKTNTDPTGFGLKNILEGPYNKRLKNKRNGLEGQYKVLVVDDEPFNILAIQSLFQTFGISAEGVYNGREAIQKVLEKGKNIDYQLILMDCQMPIMNGYETAKALNEIFLTKGIKEIPIVGCSGFLSKEHHAECLKSGMKEALTKPICKEKADDIIKRYITQSE